MRGQGCLNCWWGFRRYDYAIKKLEKVKAEIKENAECKVTDKSVRYVKLTDVLTILDKELSELKGETE